MDKGTCFFWICHVFLLLLHKIYTKNAEIYIDR